MNITLKGNKKQFEIIKEGLELYSRLGIGQFYALDNLSFFRSNMTEYRIKEELFEQLKSLYFPELPKGTQHSICSDVVALECKLARNLVKRIEGLTKESIYTIEIDKQAANTILESLDVYSRIGMGQFEEIARIRFLGYNYEKSQEISRVLDSLKALYYPELQYVSYWGIFSNKCPKESKIAWDILQVIRHDISWFEHPTGGWTVNFDSPNPSSEEPLCKCSILG